MSEPTIPYISRDKVAPLIREQRLPPVGGPKPQPKGGRRK